MRVVTLMLVWCVALSSCRSESLVPSAEAALLVCSSGTFPLVAAPPQAMLVLDRSGSMATASGAGTRWSAILEGLSLALPAKARDLELGLTLFPSPSVVGDECAVTPSPSVRPALDSVDTILGTLRGTTLAGGTPTASALDAALSGFTSASNRALVLVTDGVPNCNPSLNPQTCACQGRCSAERCIDDARTLERLESLASSGIPTWVIGVGSEVSSNALLDAMAVAGGRPFDSTPRYAEVSSPSAVAAVFDALTDELAACTFVSPSVPSATDLVTLRLGVEEVPYDASGVSGWSWSSLSSGVLAVRGQWCRRLATLEAPALVLEVRCADAGVARFAN